MSPGPQFGSFQLQKKPKTKRKAPYVNSACDICRQRKLRCSGGQPCIRCKERDIPCEYPEKQRRAMADSPMVSRTMSAKMKSNLSDIVNDGIADLDAMAAEIKAQLWALLEEPIQATITEDIITIDASPSRLVESQASIDNEPRNHSPVNVEILAGPTSSMYSVNQARRRMSNLDGNGMEALRPINLATDRFGLPESTQTSSQTARTPLTGHDGRYLEALTLQEVQLCIAEFERDFAVLHPISHLQQLKAQAPELLHQIQTSRNDTLYGMGECGLVEIFKIVITIVFAARTNLDSQTGLQKTIYKTIEPLVNSSALRRTMTYDFRALLFLTAVYHWYIDDYVLAARLTMIAIRTAIEEGLYQIDILQSKISDETEQIQMICLLWNLFVLDMQLNFAAGLPQTLDEDDIDLPMPHTAPYLHAMVKYVIFGRRSWISLVIKGFLSKQNAPPYEALEFFRYQLHRWQQELDPQVRFDAVAIETGGDSLQSQAKNYPSTLLYLRSNQIRILVLRPALMSFRKAQNNAMLVKEVVEVACKSIKTLECMFSNTQLYATKRVVLNHFLTSSLSVLILAAAYNCENIRSTDKDTALESPDFHNTLQIGLDLLDQQHTRKFTSCFAEARSQLARLGVISEHRGSSAWNEMPLSSDEPPMGTSSAERENLPDEIHELNFGVYDFFDSSLNDELLDLNWFEGSFMDPTNPA